MRRGRLHASTAERTAKVVLHPALAGRLAAYLDAASRLAGEDRGFVASAELASHCGVNPAQVRRDLAAIHLVGTRGVGYQTDAVIEAVRLALGLRDRRELVLFGAGGIGLAVATGGLLREGRFVVRDVFDDDPDRIGLTLGGKTVRPAEELGRGPSGYAADAIGIVARAGGVQRAAELLAASGVRTILSYSGAPLRAPRGVRVCRAEPAVQLLHTLHYLTRPGAGRAALPSTAVGPGMLQEKGAPWEG